LGGSVYTAGDNIDAIVVASKEIELEINADRTKYMVMSRDQNEGRSHDIKTGNISLELNTNVRADAKHV